LNLGYVAEASLKSFHHNLGLLILVQGEKFRPTFCESVVDEIIFKFLESIKDLD